MGKPGYFYPDGTVTNNASVAMGVLIGDVNGSGGVNSTDVSLVQAQSGRPVTSSNFRNDVNASGGINSTDVSIVQSRSGTGVSPFSLGAPAPITYMAYDGWDLIAEYGAGATSASNAYLAGAGGLVKNLVSNRYYYQDGSGSTSHLADSTGHLLEWYRYNLQGTPVFYNSTNQLLNSSTFGVRHLFTGQQWYGDLGLYDLRNRFYSPDIGRFLQSDPIGFAGDPSNIYRYCGNNPINRHDPSGLIEPERQSATGYEGLPSAEPVNVFGRDPLDLMGWGGTAYYPDGGVFGTYNLDPAFGLGGWGRGNWGALAGNSFLKPYGGPNPQLYLKELTLPQFSQESTNPNVGVPDLTQNPFDSVPPLNMPIPLTVQALAAELHATYNFVSNSNVPGMNPVQYIQFMRNLNTGFYDPHKYEFPIGSGNVYSGHAINYIGVGMGLAARGFGEETMSVFVAGYRMGQSGTFYGGEFMWAELGYESYNYLAGH